MAMVILTLAGADRPGLVSRISEQIASQDGSWMESRLAHLAGQFTGIVLASLPDGRVAALEQGLAAFAADGVRVTLHHAAITPPPAPEAALTLSLVCQDRPGIIRDIAAVLAALHVNIEELTTNVLSGSFSGEPMFNAEARLRLPEGVSIEAVRRDLEQLGNDLMVDIQFSEPHAVA